MAIYHCSAKVFSRSKGHSAVAAAAYRTGTCIRDERTGIVHDYSRRHGVEERHLFVPQDAPEWARSRGELWNEVEDHERRVNSTLAREIEVSIPHELTAEQRKALAHEFGQWLVAEYGCAVDMGMHEPCNHKSHPTEDGRILRKSSPLNWHVHYQMTTRSIDEDGWGAKLRVLDDKAEIRHIRAVWAEMANRALEQAGCAERIDHRSLATQRAEALAQGDLKRAAELERVPGVHLGTKHAAIERDGRATLRGEECRRVETLSEAVREARGVRERLEAEVEELTKRTEEMRSGGVPAETLEETVQTGQEQDALAAVEAREALEEAQQEALERDHLEQQPDLTVNQAEVAKEVPEPQPTVEAMPLDLAAENEVEEEREAREEARQEALERALLEEQYVGDALAAAQVPAEVNAPMVELLVASGEVQPVIEQQSGPAVEPEAGKEAPEAQPPVEPPLDLVELLEAEKELAAVDEVRQEVQEREQQSGPAVEDLHEVSRETQPTGEQPSDPAVAQAEASLEASTTQALGELPFDPAMEPDEVEEELAALKEARQEAQERDRLEQQPDPQGKTEAAQTVVQAPAGGAESAVELPDASRDNAQTAPVSVETPLALAMEPAPPPTVEPPTRPDQEPPAIDEPGVPPVPVLPETAVVAVVAPPTGAPQLELAVEPDAPKVTVHAPAGGLDLTGQEPTALDAAVSLPSLAPPARPRSVAAVPEVLPDEPPGAVSDLPRASRRRPGLRPELPVPIPTRAAVWLEGAQERTALVLLEHPPATVLPTGDALYRVADGGVVVERCDVPQVEVREVSAQAIDLAIDLAQRRVQGPLYVYGDEAFQRQVVERAAVRGIEIHYSSGALEAERVAQQQAERRLEESRQAAGQDAAASEALAERSTALEQAQAELRQQLGLSLPSVAVKPPAAAYQEAGSAAPPPLVHESSEARDPMPSPEISSLEQTRAELLAELGMSPKEAPAAKRAALSPSQGEAQPKGIEEAESASVESTPKRGAGQRREWVDPVQAMREHKARQEAELEALIAEADKRAAQKEAEKKAAAERKAELEEQRWTKDGWPASPSRLETMPLRELRQVEKKLVQLSKAERVERDAGVREAEAARRALEKKQAPSRGELERREEVAKKGLSTATAQSEALRGQVFGSWRHQEELRALEEQSQRAEGELAAIARKRAPLDKELSEAKEREEEARAVAEALAEQEWKRQAAIHVEVRSILARREAQERRGRAVDEGLQQGSVRSMRDEGLEPGAGEPPLQRGPYRGR